MTAEAEAILNEWINARQRCFGCLSDACDSDLADEGTCGYKDRAKHGKRPHCPKGHFMSNGG